MSQEFFFSSEAPQCWKCIKWSTDKFSFHATLLFSFLNTHIALCWINAAAQGQCDGNMLCSVMFCLHRNSPNNSTSRLVHQFKWLTDIRFSVADARKYMWQICCFNQIQFSNRHGTAELKFLFWKLTLSHEVTIVAKRLCDEGATPPAPLLSSRILILQLHFIIHVPKLCHSLYSVLLLVRTCNIFCLSVRPLSIILRFLPPFYLQKVFLGRFS